MKCKVSVAFFIECFFRAILITVLGFVIWYLFMHTYLEMLSDIRRQLYLDVTEQESRASQLLYVFLWSMRIVGLLLEFFAISRTTAALSAYNDGAYIPSKFILFFEESVKRNLLFIKSIPRGIRYVAGTLLLFYAFFLTYCIIRLPFHYDEIFSYRFFSGKGLLSSLAFYPLPNNHVLFNLLSAVPLHLPIDPLIATRLISLLATLASVYYFFKLCYRFFSPHIALISSVLFAFSFPVLLYASQARGYALLLFFSVLCVYAVICLLEEEDQKKYFLLYSISCVLGLWTIPSFLYAIVVTSTVLFLRFCLRPSKAGGRLLVGAHLFIPLATFLLYLPIILRNGKESLYKNNGITARDLNYIRQHLKSHLLEIWNFFAGTSTMNVNVLWLLSAGLMLTLFTASRRQRWPAFLAVFFLLSPIPIVLLHKVIPFTRTWIYLMVPLCLGLGFAISLIARILVPIRNRIFTKDGSSTHYISYVSAATLLLALTCSARFINKHSESNAIDYVVRNYCTRLSPKLSLASVVVHTREDMSFYLAETIAFECNRCSGGAPLSLLQVGDGDSVDADIVAFDKQHIPVVDMSHYRLLPDDNPFFLVYIRRGF